MSDTMPPPAPMPPPGMPMGAGPPGMPPGPPQPTPNPAFAQWMQQAQQVQQIMQENQRRQKQFDDACALIRKDGVDGFRLDIESDSTIEPDEQAEKAARVEFLQQMIPMLQSVVPIAQGNPALAEMASQMVMFALRGFRVSRPLEEAFEKGFEAIAKMPPVPPKGQTQGPHGPDPATEQAKVAAEVHDTQTKAQTDMAAIAQKSQQANMQLQIAQEKGAAEMQKSQMDAAMEAQKIQSQERVAAARVLSQQARSTGGMV